MKFKGTIVITDPCYIIKDPIGSLDDWEVCKYGENMEVLGINHYITGDTIYGDWSCTTYASEKPMDAINNLAKIANYFRDNYKSDMTLEQHDKLCQECESMEKELNLNLKEIGNFSSDTGLVSVLLLDEVLKYNSDFEPWALEHPWCATIIKDFDGDIEYYIDEVGEAHIIGNGSINFFTSQI